MKPLRIHTGIAAPLDRPNVDTDQIIPKQFLKLIGRTGYGKFLFYDWRYKTEDQPDTAFVLNDPRYNGRASVLIAGRNFGCGSSREHAVWALYDYGFRVVLALSFADIFSSNAVKNGLATVVLTEEEIAELTRRARDIQDYQLTIDLENKQVKDALGFKAAITMDEFRRQCLLEGLDDIKRTLQQEASIAAFEGKRRPRGSPKTGHVRSPQNRP
ncbi:MAG: 3-isopropylmalate dehydratase small subunit [Acidobacteriia bacterium]|nr:3-isopropylmalate dehydratase small subunit [Terriglobia bacterium]